MIAGSGDNAAAVRGRADGRFLVSHGDREQVVELLKTAFVDDRLTREEFDARVGRALGSRTRADLAALTADIPGGLDVSQPPPRAAARGQSQPPAKYTPRHAVKTDTSQTGTARVGGALAVAAKLTVVMMFVTGIPPLFLVLVLFCVVAVIVAVAWIRS